MITPYVPSEALPSADERPTLPDLSDLLGVDDPDVQPGYPGGNDVRDPEEGRRRARSGRGLEGQGVISVQRGSPSRSQSICLPTSDATAPK